jgi:4-amino-4-deoxy-L-arabinose transferase-like glycosyltransferase
LGVLVCASFSLVASLACLVARASSAELVQDVPLWGLWVRAAFFLVASVVAVVTMWRLRLAPIDREPHEETSVEPGGSWGLLLALAFAALLIFPRLDGWPWAAPDEVHHLRVAKNLALYGHYASGNPDDGFLHFDPYDSVGAPVIMPVAAALRVGGISVVSGRVVIGLYFLLLCGALYFLARSVFGRPSALLAALLAPMAFSSLYLARTLYGEVPAFAWFLLGLLAWRSALAKPSGVAHALVAGLCFSCAVLSKSILVLALFPAAAIYLWDCLGPRRIPFRAILVPALGAGCGMGLWLLYQRIHHADPSEVVGEVAGVYQHNLLFGVESLTESFSRWWWDYPLAHLVSLATTLFVVPRVFFRRYDPALALLFLLALLFGYWWLFFTPGRIPRYYWYGNLSLALFTAPLLAACWKTIAADGAMSKRLLAGVAALLIVASPLHWLWLQGREVLLNDEMRQEAAVVEAIRILPKDARVGIDFHPLSGLVDFCADRRVETIPTDVDRADWDVLVFRGGNVAVPTGWRKNFIGPYRVERRRSDSLGSM